MGTRRVVITGMGVVTPYGTDMNNFWNSLVEGKSAISNITKFNTEQYAVKIAGEVKDLPVEQYIDAKEQKRMDAFIHYGIIAAELALKDAGITFTDQMKERTGVFAASGIGGLITIQENNQKLLEKGPGRISPMFIPMVLSNMLPGHISMRHKFTGPNISIVSACASGAHCIGHAFLTIQENKADFMIAGAAEAAVCELGIGGFAAMRALSSRNDEPQKASRPWDKDRDGFVMSEGGAFVVLEEYEHAKKRGAHIYAELVGYGLTADANHITAPAEDGNGAKRCMELAVKEAGISPDKIDYINAHGTSTPLGDIAECNAVKGAFGKSLDKLNVSSTKSMTGHMLGAAGSIEVVITALAMKHGVVPPTINLDNIDPACAGVNLTPNTAVKKNMEYALSNSFGFGGTNCSVVLKKL
ncbi:MAG TPA: beta-ketoacyl-ACP synthase II [bacterium]|nr:beta-ketoacyl-ACP synthase II [bacterium]